LVVETHSISHSLLTRCRNSLLRRFDRLDAVRRLDNAIRVRRMPGNAAHKGAAADRTPVADRIDRVMPYPGGSHKTIRAIDDARVAPYRTRRGFM
jgi:hypothetical protein